MAWTWSATKGADLTWVPIPFERSFRMAYERTHYGTGYYIYHRYAGGAPLSQPIRSWNGNAVPDKDVLDLIAQSGSDLVAKADSAEGKQIGIEQKSGEIILPAKESVLFAEIEKAPSMIRALEFSVPRASSLEFGRLRLRVTWDRRPAPSIDCTDCPLLWGGNALQPRRP